jgi:carbonic anhydrase/acetyltransferase-like protein (isoleucine patch superfamily)
MVRSFAGQRPRIHKTAFVHDSAEIIGRVVIEEGASIWPGCVLRGDISEIRIGAGANIQDLTVIHTREGHPTIVGPGVTVGHNVILHGCRIGQRTLVGMGAIVMEATVGDQCLIGAGTLITAGAKIKPRSLVVGTPGRTIRSLKPDELKMLAKSELSYRKLAEHHRETSHVVFRA